MQTTQTKSEGRARPRSMRTVIVRFTDWAVRFGVSGYDRETRRRLSICNIAGYLSALSSLSFAINFMMFDMADMKWLIAGNLLSALLTTTAPLWHRVSPVASPIVLASTVAVTLFFFHIRIGPGFGHSTQLHRFGSYCICDIRAFAHAVCNRRYVGLHLGASDKLLFV